MASCTKVIVTTSCKILKEFIYIKGIMNLYETGKISLKDKLSKYVPEANNNGKEDIIIENLLLHNAGLTPDYDFNTGYNVTA